MVEKLILLFSVLVLLVGCTHAPQTESEKNEVITIQQNKISELQTEINILKEKLKEDEPKPLSYTVNLRSWTNLDIIKALGKKELEYKDQKLQEFIYNDDGTFFYYEGELFSKDPFNDLTYRRRGFEIKPGHFRIFDLSERQKDSVEIYAEYKDKILKEATLSQDIICIKEASCNNEIELVTCKRNKDTLYIWNKNQYMFTAMNDNGKGFETFKAVFCAQNTPSLLTGLFVLDIKTKLREILR